MRWDDDDDDDDDDYVCTRLCSHLQATLLLNIFIRSIIFVYHCDKRPNVLWNSPKFLKVIFPTLFSLITENVTKNRTFIQETTLATAYITVVQLGHPIAEFLTRCSYTTSGNACPTGNHRSLCGSRAGGTN